METLSNNFKTPYFNPAVVFNKPRENQDFQIRKVVVMDKQECIFLKMDDISCAEANGAYTNVYLINGKKMVVCKNLKAFSAKLPENEFFRVHKSYIININSISKYVKSDGGYLILDNGKSIPVSVRKKDVLTELVERLAL